MFFHKTNSHDVTGGVCKNQVIFTAPF